MKVNFLARKFSVKPLLRLLETLYEGLISQSKEVILRKTSPPSGGKEVAKLDENYVKAMFCMILTMIFCCLGLSGKIKRRSVSYGCKIFFKKIAFF